MRDLVKRLREAISENHGEAPAKKAKDKTFVQAKADALKHLENKGWKISPSNLKIPHATSPDGETRLWFKAQAVYFTQGNRHDFKHARTISYDMDLRKMSPEEFEGYVSKKLK